MAFAPQEGQYWSLLESTQQQQFPEFVKYLAAQEGPTGEEGQAAVIEFQDNARPRVRKLATSRVLRSYLNEHHPTATVRRRVFVLEGLPRNFIQVLGANLKVPPDFFASHWTDPGSFAGNLLNRTQRHYDSESRFILTFPKLHRARIKKQEGDDSFPFYYMESSVHRPLFRTTIFGDTNGPLTSSEQLSFWSMYNGDSWDAILLVDPPLGKFVRWKDSQIPREVDRDSSIKLVDLVLKGLDQRGSWYPSYTSAAVLGSNPADWRNAEQLPGMESMFKDIILLYPMTERAMTANPISCMDICRKIVLSAWTARLRVAEAQIVQEQYMMSIGSIEARIGNGSVFERSWERPWCPQDFGRLVRAKSALESIDWELYRNMDALTVSKTKPKDTWEAEAWISLQKAVQALKSRLDITSEAYMQAVSIRESITANKQAQQVGYLTSLATVFIPLSFVAAIFSMGGDFSAGARHFWVYWVIAVPLMVTGCVLLFTKLGRCIIGNVSSEHSLV